MRLGTAMELCERHVRHAQVDCALSYGEPGYNEVDAPSGILFADWKLSFGRGCGTVGCRDVSHLKRLVHNSDCGPHD